MYNKSRYIRALLDSGNSKHSKLLNRKPLLENYIVPFAADLIILNGIHFCGMSMALYLGRFCYSYRYS
jgi:hypothetical protein